MYTSLALTVCFISTCVSKNHHQNINVTYKIGLNPKVKSEEVDTIEKNCH